MVVVKIVVFYRERSFQRNDCNTISATSEKSGDLRIANPITANTEFFVFKSSHVLFSLTLASCKRPIVYGISLEKQNYCTGSNQNG